MTDATLTALDAELDARDRKFVLSGKIPPEYFLANIALRLEIEVTEVEARMRARETP